MSSVRTCCGDPITRVSDTLRIPFVYAQVVITLRFILISIVQMADDSRVVEDHGTTDAIEMLSVMARMPAELLEHIFQYLNGMFRVHY